MMTGIEVMEIVSFIMYILVFIFLPIFLGIVVIHEQKTCNQETSGIYKGYAEQYAKGVRVYYPRFAYEYNGKTYENVANQGLNYCDICKYNTEEHYTIFINKNDPNCFVVEKSKPIGAYICIIIGMTFSLLLCFIKDNKI